MKKLKEFMDKKPGLAAAIGAGTILFIGVLIFLFTKDNELNPNSITGLQALQQEGGNFWFGAFLWTAFGVLVIWLANKYIIKSQDLRGVTGNVTIAVAVFLAAAWGKACTTKTNDGVTGEKGRPVKIEKVDDGRVPAEDLLKKQ